MFQSEWMILRKQSTCNHVWWNNPVIPALGQQILKDLKFKVIFVWRIASSSQTRLQIETLSQNDDDMEEEEEEEVERLEDCREGSGSEVIFSSR